MQFAQPITDLRAVGPALAAKFKRLGIETLGDLSHNYPRRYDDYSVATSIASLQPGLVTVRATITEAKSRYIRRGMHITEAIATDSTGSLRLVWFNQPYRAAGLKAGREYYISGQYELRSQRFALTNPALESTDNLPTGMSRIMPIYRETKGLSSKQIQAAIAQLEPLHKSMPDTLPSWLLRQQKLLPLGAALQAIHFPQTAAQLDAARHRLGFEEVFRLALASLLNKQENQREQAHAIDFNETLAKQFVQALPFTLTDDQRRVIWRIYLDMQRTEPMNRLVEGDVGSGKTVVAAMASLMVMAKGWQVALMAPTELLARQHADTIYGLLAPLGQEHAVTLLVGSLSTAQKSKARQAIATGQAQFVIGTHAIFQEAVAMEKLGLVIIDEQHRFGVEQRKSLQAKARRMPHVLHMTATPIPRSLALTLYGELDISILAHKPPGRQPVHTEVISPNSRAQLYQTIDTELDRGRQMFVVCPLISDSDALVVASAEAVYERLQKRDFKHRRIGLLHGKLKPEAKIAVMQQFVDHEIDILVSTTVIEVGVDVPNASIMLLEGAERFGLAQIHQLRGRVGRGGHAGYCYLIPSDSKRRSKRLQALELSDDGFKLAELDLELRGPGAIYGISQHGQLDLRIAKLSDTKQIAAARQAAHDFIERGENLLQYPELAVHISRLRAITNVN